MPKVDVLTELCKSCLYCIDVCPKKILELSKEVNTKGYQHIMAVKPDECTGCALCAVMCPDAAIEIWK